MFKLRSERQIEANQKENYRERCPEIICRMFGGAERESMTTTQKWIKFNVVGAVRVYRGDKKEERGGR